MAATRQMNSKKRKVRNTFAFNIYHSSLIVAPLDDQAHEAFDSERLPTSSIITTGEKYVTVTAKLIRDVIHITDVEPIEDLCVGTSSCGLKGRYPTKRVYKSDEYHVGLTQNNNSLREELKRVLQRIVGIFTLQKQRVDESEVKPPRQYAGGAD